MSRRRMPASIADEVVLACVANIIGDRSAATGSRERRKDAAGRNVGAQASSGWRNVGRRA